MEEEIHSQMLISDMVLEENPGLLEDDSVEKTHEDYAKGIIDYIEEHGGVANAEWKRKTSYPKNTSMRIGPRKRLGQRHRRNHLLEAKQNVVVLLQRGRRIGGIP